LERGQTLESESAAACDFLLRGNPPHRPVCRSMKKE